MEHILLIDGYNVIRRTPAMERRFQADPEAARAALLRYCKEWRSVRRDASALWVVFDGDAAVVGRKAAAAAGVRVIFSGGGETADDRIATLVRACGSGRRFTVVSDDAELARRCRQLGAASMTAGRFRQTLRRQRRKTAAGAREAHKPKVAPHVAQAITRSLMREWGVEPHKRN
ncbi:MAG: NYN domain-containing protein [Lentisphaerae bacterium]|nr:NYN domain-containing protein [Lentisphaerota bacterium]